MMGTQQSGNLDFLIADLAQDSALVLEARKAAEEILKSTPVSEEEETQIDALLKGGKQERFYFNVA